MEQDFLDEIMAESTKQNPDYPRLYAQAWREEQARHSLGARKFRPVLYHKSTAPPRNPAEPNGAQSIVCRRWIRRRSRHIRTESLATSS